MNEPDARRVASLSVQVFGLVAASVVLEIVAQALPPHYSPIRDTESVLAVGPYRALEMVSLALRGGLVFLLLRAAAIAIPAPATSFAGMGLLGLAAAAKFAIAFVPTDLTPRPETVNGTVHAVLAFVSFFAGAIGEVLIARRLLTTSWMPGRLLLRVAGITVVWSVIITIAVGMETGVWGILERIETSLLLGWIAVFAVALHRRAQAALSGRS